MNLVQGIQTFVFAADMSQTRPFITHRYMGVDCSSRAAPLLVVVVVQHQELHMESGIFLVFFLDILPSPAVETVCGLFVALVRFQHYKSGSACHIGSILGSQWGARRVHERRHGCLEQTKVFQPITALPDHTITGMMRAS